MGGGHNPRQPLSPEAVRQQGYEVERKSPAAPMPDNKINTSVLQVNKGEKVNRLPPSESKNHVKSLIP